MNIARDTTRPKAVGEPKVRVRQHLPLRRVGGLGLLALRASGSRGSDSPPACHSLPLPFESALPRTKKHGMPEWTFRVFCERAVKRCIKVGKNSKKVCDFALLTTRQIGICRLVVLIYFLNLKHIYGIYIGATENIIL